MDTSSIDELKRAFEFVEVSSPGITDQLLSRIAVYLQHRYHSIDLINRPVGGIFT